FTEMDLIKYFRMERALKKWIESEKADSEARSTDADKLRLEAYHLTIEALPELKLESNTSFLDQSIKCKTCIRDVQRCNELGYHI
ncbi:hypothetical protein LCGC14_2858380, partial [marine sediment metagenome]